MSEELQVALTVLASALTSGITGALTTSRAVRRRLRKLERMAKGYGDSLRKLEDGQRACEANRAQVAQLQRHADKRISWLMGGVQALLAAFRLRPAPAGVAHDAEATGTSGPPRRSG